MGHFYKHGRVWRLSLIREGERKDISLGEDFHRAKLLRASIEQAWQDNKFKGHLMETLQSLGLLETSFKIPDIASEEKPPSWEESKQKLLGHLRKISRRNRTIELAMRSLKSIEEIVKPNTTADVTCEAVDHWIATLSSQINKRDKFGTKKVSSAYVAMQVRSAKACFRWFVRWKLITSNPFNGCDMPKVERSLPNPITDEDLEKLLKACNAPLKRCIKILVYSGMRPDEFFHLTWKKVQLQDKPGIMISSENGWVPKTHMQRIIPCTPELLEALGKPGLPDALVAGYNEHDIPLSMYWLQRSFKRAIKRAGLKEKGYTPYCCRDTYATNLALQGYEAHAIAARLGHNNLQTSMHYVSLARVIADTKSMKNKNKQS